MSKKAISTEKAPAAIGPYSQAICTGDLLFISGQLGLNPETGKLAGDTVEEQCRQSFANIKAILAEAAMTMDNVVKCIVYLTNMGDFAAVNKIYAEQFAAPFPARCAFAVSALPAGGVIEIEVTAAK